MITLANINEHMTRTSSRLLSSDGWGQSILNIERSSPLKVPAFNHKVESVYELKVSTRLITPAPFNNAFDSNAASSIHHHLYSGITERLWMLHSRMQFLTKDEALQLLNKIIEEIEG